LLLRFHFHKTIGAGKNFDFDVSSANPSWISDVEDVRDVRVDEAGIGHRLPARQPQPYNAHGFTIIGITRLVDMGFSREEAAIALEWAAGDVAAAANHLLGV
jgi:hypothetical protein